MLAPLVTHWVPEAFVVSFKLETDESLLLTKSKAALQKYHHKVSGFFIYLFCFEKGMGFALFYARCNFKNGINFIIFIMLLYVPQLLKKKKTFEYNIK